MLRYVGETAATIWVETDRACQVEVLGHRERTFHVAGHHYALVVVDGLAPGTEYEYQVALDGAVRWPAPGSGFPPSVLRTHQPDQPQRLLFGSCRIAELPAPRGRAQRQEHGPDAMAACARELARLPRERWPGILLLIGDQVYADETGSATRRFIQARRDPSVPPGYEAADFTEYCALYREAWSEPAVRWLLSAPPTIMIFDDHDVHDDWNSSAAWRREYEAKPWWRSRITGAYMSYWLYQHLGNLSPGELGKDEVWRQSPGRRRRGGRAGRARPHREPQGRRRPGGASAATSEPSGSSSSTRAAAGSSGTTAGGGWSTRRSGSGSPNRCPVTGTTSCSPRRCRAVPDASGEPSLQPVLETELSG